MSAEPINEAPAPTAAQSAQAAGLRRGGVERRLGLPPRPKTRELAPDTEWMAAAVCATAPEADRPAFVTVDRQDDAWPLVARYCSSCPVSEACLVDGRQSHLHGLAGGYVLADGHLAPDVPGYRAYRSTAAWMPPWDRDEADEPGTAPLAAVLEPELAALLVALAREAGSITAAGAAQALEEHTGTRPTTKRARAHLETLEAAGHLVGEPSPTDGRRTIGRWTAAVGPVPTTARTQRWQPVGRRRARRKGRR